MPSERLPGRPSEQSCPDCGEPLWIVTLTGGEDVLAPCLDCTRRANEAQFIRESLELAAQMSPLHGAAALDEFVTGLPHQARGKAAAQAFLSEMQRGKPLALVLWSTGYGTGKTHLASAIANEARRCGWIVESWLMPEFLSKVRASYDKDSEHDEYSIVRQATGAHLLVLDDVGKEHVVTEAWYQ
ncbi:MAG: ATP-binding protein, partial [Proteobacteria bacterium]|nr:ATP-binding protein [Pseudomonadota bacterium]